MKLFLVIESNNPVARAFAVAVARFIVDAIRCCAGRLKPFGISKYVRSEGGRLSKVCGCAKNGALHVCQYL